MVDVDESTIVKPTVNVRSTDSQFTSENRVCIGNPACLATLLNPCQRRSNHLLLRVAPCVESGSIGTTRSDDSGPNCEGVHGTHRHKTESQ